MPRTMKSIRERVARGTEALSPAEGQVLLDEIDLLSRTLESAKILQMRYISDLRDRFAVALAGGMAANLDEVLVQMMDVEGMTGKRLGEAAREFGVMVYAAADKLVKASGKESVTCPEV